MSAEPFAIVYDLRDDAARRKLHRDRSFWGKLYTHVCMLDRDHVMLTFHPAPNPRWRKWEEVRRRWLFESEAS